MDKRVKKTERRNKGRCKDKFWEMRRGGTLESTVWDVRKVANPMVKT